MVVVGATTQSAKSPWRPLPARLLLGRRYVTVRLNHFSWLRIFGIDIADALSALKQEFLDSVDLGFNARRPTCANEAEARSGGWSIASDNKNTIYWCFGVESGRRVLKVVNHRRYPLAVAHPGLAVIDAGSFRLDLSHLSRLVSGRETIVFPADQATFGVSIPSGSTGGIRTEFDAVGFSLYQLEVGVSTALTLLTRFGAGSTEQSTQKIANFLAIPQCAEALGESGLSIITKCFSPADLLEVFSWKGLLLAPLMVAGPVLNFFESAANSAFDQLNHRDSYRVLITHTGTAPPPPPPPPATPPPATQPAQPQPAAPTGPPAGYNVGDTFDDSCSVAWPTAPDRSSTAIYMRLQCVHLPSYFQFVDVTYGDPNLDVHPGTVMHVHGKIADIAKSGYGFRVLVVGADRIDVTRR